MMKTVKGLKMSFDSTPFGAITRVKQDMIREVVQQPASQIILRVEWIKALCKIK